MTNSPKDAVVAGSKAFAVALLAPLAARVGTRPRVAADPAQALAVCRGPSALAVIEYVGEASLPAVETLVAQGQGLRIVVGVPEIHAGAEDRLRALGVEVVRWDGRAEPVVEVAARGIGAPPAAAPRPAAPPRAPAQPAAPPATPPRAAAPPAAAARPAPRVIAPPPPSLVPAAAAAPRPAAPAPVAVSAPAAPVPVPAAVIAPPVAHAPPADLFGDLACEEDVPADFEPAPAAPPTPAFPAFPAGIAVPAPGPAPRMSAAPGASAASLAALQAPAAAARRWPSEMPDEASADDALTRAGRGLPDESPLQALCEQVLPGLSEVERAVLSGAPQPFDAALVRRAAVMRVRVAAALAARPEPGTPYDAAAVSSVLAEIDALLAAVGAAAAALPPESRPLLEAVRNGLVREAIDFSEGASQLASAPAPAAAKAAPAPERKPVTRVLTMDPAAVEEPRKRPVALWIVFGLMALATLGYHASNLLSRPPPRPPAMADAPAGMRAASSGGRTILTAEPGKQVEPAALEKFRAAEAARGNEVVEVAPGVFVVQKSVNGGKAP